MIIGTGIGEWAAAVRLAARGVHVVMIEERDQAGGTLRRRVIPHPARPSDRPFTFDISPILTLPFVFQDLFAAVDADVRDYLSIQRLSPCTRFIWQDGQTLDIPADEQQLLETVRRLAPEDGAGFERFLELGRRFWNAGGEALLAHPESRTSLLSPRSLVDGLRRLILSLRLGTFTTYGRLVDRLIRDARLRDVLHRYASDAGTTPALAPATFAVIPFCELHFGVWHLRGGMHTLAEALRTLATKLGVEIRTSASIKQIHTSSRGRKRAVNFVETSTGERIDCDAVLCGSEAASIQQPLIRDEDRRHVSETSRASKQASDEEIFLLLGIEGVYPHLGHRTALLPDASQDPQGEHHIEVFAPTRTDSSLAPDGCECLIVRCSARQEASLVETLERRFGLSDLSHRIVVRHRVTPAERGHAAGDAESNTARPGLSRQPHRDRQTAGLFYTGGVDRSSLALPLAALSGKIACELICEHLGIREPGIIELSDRLIAEM